MPRLLQRIGHFLRHVGLVMFGENRIGIEQARAVERALSDDALPFAEQIGQYALVCDGYLVAAVGNVEADFQIVAADQASDLYQSAEPNASARCDMLLRHVTRRIKEHDRIAECIEHERNGDCEHAEPAADQDKASALTGHCFWFPP